MASMLTRRLLAIRPLARTLPRQVVLVRFNSSASSREGADTPFFERAMPRDEIRGGMEELFRSRPPPEAEEPEAPEFTLSAKEIEAYKALLPDHLDADKYKDFIKTPEHQDVLKIMKSRGATEDDINGFEYFILDPEMNGGYINPPAIKRSARDPYADWWDKQERRNYGEPVHEDNDMLGVFSFEDYDVFKPKQVFQGWAIFITAVTGLTGLVYMYGPSRVSVKRDGTDGLAEAGVVVPSPE